MATIDGIGHEDAVGEITLLMAAIPIEQPMTPFTERDPFQ